MDYYLEIAKKTFLEHFLLEFRDDPKDMSVVVTASLYEVSSKVELPEDQNRFAVICSKFSSLEANAAKMDVKSIVVKDNTEALIRAIVKKHALYCDMQNSFWKRLKFLFKA